MEGSRSPEDPSHVAPRPELADGNARRPTARQNHALLSLVELSHKLWSAQDVYDAAEALLLNLMGQVGTAQAALWLGTTGAGEPVLIRCHGIDRPLARALGAVCWTDLVDPSRPPGRPVIPSELKTGLGKSVEPLARQAQVALFAPLCVEDSPKGMVALGARFAGQAYTTLELEILESSLAVAGLAIRSAHLHGLAIESDRKLRRANAELQELDRMKSEFIDHLNHELRTPLTVVQGSLECLLECPSHARAEVLLVAATQGVEQMMRLVHRLVTLSESVSQDLRLRMEEADVAAFLGAYHEMRRAGVAAGLRELHQQGLDGPRMARFDSQHLTQVLDELVDNAVKFSPLGSNIWLRLSDWVEDGQDWVRVSVDDDGFGIPRESLPLLFQTFRQLDGSLTREAGGLGIGLAAAKQLIEAMNGRISAASEADRGSTFSLLLPAL
jgi:signal transduction histidine kinase